MYRSLEKYIICDNIIVCGGNNGDIKSFYIKPNESVITFDKMRKEKIKVLLLDHKHIYIGFKSGLIEC